MPKVYIIKVMRSPIGKTNGALAHLRPEIILASLIKEMRSQVAGIPEEVLIASAVGLGGNIGRLALLEGGMPQRVSGTSLDFQCGGSLKTLEYGFYSIASGHRSLVYTGGVESTSLEAKVTLNSKDPKYHGEEAEKRGQFSPDKIGDPDMLEGAENCYQLLKPSNEAIEAIVLRSHQRATKAREERLLERCIVPQKGLDDQWYSSDESIRSRMSMRSIQKAPSLIKKGGHTTAANSCLTHDGASLIALASENLVKALGLDVLAEVIGIESVGLNPNYSPLGPVLAVRRLMKRFNLSEEAIGVVEVNEAFAIKTWAVQRYCTFSNEQVNPLGGALAYGHPYGATGGILMTHLLKGLEKTKEKYGIATMGVAGGQGIAVLVRRIDG